MQPVELEIIMRNNTQQGLNQLEGDLNRMGKTVEEVSASISSEMQQLQGTIQQLESDIGTLRKQLESVNNSSGETAHLVSDLELVEKVVNDQKKALSELGKQLDVVNAKTAKTTQENRSQASSWEALGNAFQGANSIVNAGVSAAALLGVEQERLTRIQTKLQQATTLLNSVNQIATLVNKENYLSSVVLVNIKNLMTAANTRLTASLWGSAAAAQALMATLTMGLSVVIVGLIALWDKYADSQRKEQEAQQAAADAVKQRIAQEEELQKRVAGTVSDQLVNYKKLQNAYSNLGDDLKKKQEFVESNQEAFAGLGIAVKEVSDAENLLVTNEDIFIRSLTNRAMATAALDLASEKYKEGLAKMIAAESKFKAADRLTLDDLTPEALKGADGLTSKLGVAGKTDLENVLNLHKTGIRREGEALKKAGQEIMEQGKENILTSMEWMKGSNDLWEVAGFTAPTHAKEKKQDSVLSDTGDISKETLKLQQKHQQEIIDQLEEGAEKRRRQLELNYEKEKQLIEEKEEELKKAQEGKLTQQQAAELATDYFNLQQNYEQGVSQLEDEKKEKLRLERDQQAWQKYLKEYGAFHEQREAIEQEYADKLANAAGEGEAKLIQKQEEEALKAFDVAVLEKTKLWEKLFSDTSEHTSNYINDAIKEAQKLVDYLNGAGTEVPDFIDENQLTTLKGNGEVVKTILKQIIKQRDELNKRNPFGNLIQGFKDLKEADGDEEKEYAAGQKIVTGLQDASKAINEVSGLLTDLEMDVDGTFSKIGSALSETASMAAQGFSVGGPVGAAVGGVLGLGSSLFKMFGSAKELSEERINSYKNYISVTDELINKQKELLQSSGGASAVNIAKEIEELIGKQTDATRNIGIDYLNSGAGRKSRSHGYKLNKELKKYKDDFAAVGIDFEELGGRMTGLFDLTPEQLKSIKYDIPEAWAKIDDQTRQYLEALIEGSEEIEELKETLNEALTGITFDAARDSLKSLLLDADATMEDVANNFEDYMRQAILNTIFDNHLNEKIREWYEAFADAMGKEGGMTEKDQERLRKMYESIYTEAAEMRDSAYKAAGITNGASPEEPETSKTTQRGQAGAFQTMSQEQGTKLEGLFTSVQQHVSSMDDKMSDLSMYMYAASDSLNEITQNTSYCRHLEMMASDIQEIKRDGIKIK